MNYPTLEEMLQAGVHFGHLSSRWNPKMRPFIFSTQNKIHVINLEKTLEKLIAALEYVKDVVSRGGVVLFIGTKRQAKETVKKAAVSCGMPFVVVRWLGGTFTNFKTIQRTIKKLERLQKLRESPDFETKYTKKERLLIEREIEKLRNLFEGIKDLKKLPEAIFAIDVKHDEIAVREAKASQIKIIGLVDTNTDPEAIDYPIPSNDDAIKAITLMADAMALAVNEGKEQLKANSPVSSGGSSDALGGRSTAKAEKGPGLEKKND